MNDFSALIDDIRKARRECADILREPVTELSKIDPAFAGSITSFLRFIYERQETLLLLTETGRYWDAQIIARPINEALAKLLFISSAKGKERETRIREYWHDLSEVNALRQSDMAKRLATDAKTEALRRPYLPMILSEEAEATLRAKWTKQKRKRLEQKWSYSEITSWLNERLKSRGPEILSPFSHHYKMSSHLMHADETGLGVMEERASRSPAEVSIAETAHLAMHASDAAIYFYIAAFGILEALNHPIGGLIEAYKRFAPTADMLGKLAEPLWAGTFYDEAEARYAARFNASAISQAMPSSEPHTK